jgi:hypothetical protein
MIELPLPCGFDTLEYSRGESYNWHMYANTYGMSTSISGVVTREDAGISYLSMDYTG